MVIAMERCRDMGVNNVFFIDGDAARLRDYFEQDVRSVSPYEEDPRDMRAVCVDPDGSVAGGNLYDAGMLDILDAYVPPGEPSA